jgi:O-antigen/teichoic acid export membrane protein
MSLKPIVKAGRRIFTYRLCRGPDRRGTYSSRYSTAKMSIGFFLRAASQAGYFVIAARELSIDEFGAFVATTAVVAVLSPFSSLGIGGLLVRNVAQRRGDSASCWATAVAVTMGSGLFLAVSVSMAAQLVLPRGTPMFELLFIALGDLLVSRFIELSAQAFQAHKRFNQAAFYNLLPGLSRLTGSLIFLTPINVDPISWSAAYMIAPLPAAIFSTYKASRLFGYARPNLCRYRQEWLDGILFAVGQSSQTVYNDIDKSMLGRLGSSADAGAYAAAYRIIDLSFTPVRALLSVNYPKFFSEGKQGCRTNLLLTRKLATPALVYCLLAGASLYFAAPTMTYLLGQEYTHSVRTIQLLVAIPGLRALHYMAADSLTGSGHQKGRTLVQAAVAAVNIVMNAILIPREGLGGAVIATLAADSLLVLGMWSMALFHGGRAMDCGDASQMGIRIGQPEVKDVVDTLGR